MKIIKLFSLILVSSVVLLTQLSNTAYAAPKDKINELIKTKCGTSGFTDVSSDHINYDAITYMQSEGIVSGYPDCTYKPDQVINRAEFAKIVIAANFTDEEMEECLNERANDDFFDVPRGQWFAKYICIAKKEGIIGGYKDGNFLPTRSINFAESAKILSIGFDLDLNGEVDPWFKQYVDALATLNAIPTSITSFDQQITRGEMAEMIYRLHKPDTSKDSQTYASLYVNASKLELLYRFNINFQTSTGASSDAKGIGFVNIYSTTSDAKYIMEYKFNVKKLSSDVTEVHFVYQSNNGFNPNYSVTEKNNILSSGTMDINVDLLKGILNGDSYIYIYTENYPANAGDGKAELIGYLKLKKSYVSE